MKQLATGMLALLLAGCSFSQSNPPVFNDEDMGGTGMTDTGSGTPDEGSTDPDVGSPADMRVDSDMAVPLDDMSTDRCAAVTCADNESCNPETGECDPICDGTQTFCAGICESTASDLNNCGDCGVVCADLAPDTAHASSCTGGRCRFECDSGLADRNGDLQDPNGDGCESLCEPTTPPDEVCDGIDNDCNGFVDDNLPVTTYYADADGDGYGDPNAPALLCQAEAPTGFTLDNTDCNDNDGSAYPGNPEICDMVDNDCANGVDDGLTQYTWWRDADGDGVGGSNESTTGDCAAAAPTGFVATNTDCDDADPNNYPGNVEVCDMADNNCNNTPDEGLEQTWYLDSDGDGYGVSAMSQMACAQPANYVAIDGDCADGDPNVNPGVAEVCDGIDNNCVGGVDEGLPVTTYYVDGDGDGYGSAPMMSCEATPPTGTAVVGGDCNDGEPSIHPNALDPCDGIDSDCGMEVENPVTYYRDGDGDGYGDPSLTVIACNGTPGNFAPQAGDCDDSTALRSPGRAEVCDGLDNDCNTATNDATMCTHTVFVTQNTHVGGGIGGPANADVICRSAAQAASRPAAWGTWKAIVSSAAAPASSRLQQIGEIQNTVGDVVWNAGALFSAALRNPIGYDEYKVARTGAVWTGTAPNGSAAPNNCGGFADPGLLGQTGSAVFTDARWTDNSSSACSKSAPIYCIDGQ